VIAQNEEVYLTPVAEAEAEAEKVPMRLQFVLWYADYHPRTDLTNHVPPDRLWH